MMRPSLMEGDGCAQHLGSGFSPSPTLFKGPSLKNMFKNELKSFEFTIIMGLV
jgi:hypothetical protein